MLHLEAPTPMECHRSVNLAFSFAPKCILQASRAAFAPSIRDSNTINHAYIPSAMQNKGIHLTHMQPRLYSALQRIKTIAVHYSSLHENARVVI
ncbi:uncharacterized protein SEPMUDRAFT_148225 [Sphaerulina musiva SO2202]|uniref:Uncharacterized protein n=1 Tax=Sphaerulina musiva (strain SO2202) TaxID=692275 RepID=M3CL78_SPHMS|nr:uncharacterized protein SEPMUDRAFT_148225 [Sphaerulina musiva SO2202]EMF14543.1 hypothetical protein SEPMUDRAFT_148225 [Sphaerulina musiva SO2202]